MLRRDVVTLWSSERCTVQVIAGLWPCEFSRILTVTHSPTRDKQTSLAVVPARVRADKLLDRLIAELFKNSLLQYSLGTPCMRSVGIWFHRQRKPFLSIDLLETLFWYRVSRAAALMAVQLPGFGSNVTRLSCIYFEVRHYCAAVA